MDTSTEFRFQGNTKIKHLSFKFGRKNQLLLQFKEMDLVKQIHPSVASLILWHTFDENEPF